MIVWVCSCATGGVAQQRGTATAMQDLEKLVALHLRERGNTGHEVRYGYIEGRIRLAHETPPLEWTKEKIDG